MDEAITCEVSPSGEELQGREHNTVGPLQYYVTLGIHKKFTIPVILVQVEKSFL